MTTPRGPEEPALFDLPLEPVRSAGAVDATPRTARRAVRAQQSEASLPLFTPEEAAEAGEENRASTEGENAAEFAPTIPESVSPVRPQLVPPPSGSVRADGEAEVVLSRRFRAAAADLLVLVAVVAVQLVGAHRLGAELKLSLWPAFVLFLVAFSYLYTVIPLAFWGQTPGMVWVGIVARSRDREPLAFGQTSRRWLGGILTLAAAGLPGLLALTGRSFADRLSGSELSAVPEPA